MGGKSCIPNRAPKCHQMLQNVQICQNITNMIVCCFCGVVYCLDFDFMWVSCVHGKLWLVIRISAYMYSHDNMKMSIPLLCVLWWVLKMLNLLLYYCVYAPVFGDVVLVICA